MAHPGPPRARRSPSAAQRWSPLAAAALVASAAGLALADADAPLATVGSFAIDAASLRERAARAGQPGLAELGATWSEQRRRLLDEVLIPEALIALAAERGPVGLPPARDRVLAQSLAATLVAEATQVRASDADVREYRDRHAREFGTARALALWRILLPTEAAARQVIAELRSPTPEAFSRIARERSIDHATHMRAGNLGLVAEDGQTRVPELRVSPALFAAADRVEDGKLVPDPVPEGDAFAVVWRRSSRAATSLPEAEIGDHIAARLAERRAATARSALLEQLRREHLSEYHPETAREHEPSFPEVRQRRARPARIAAPTRTPRLLPEETDRGLR